MSNTDGDHQDQARFARLVDEAVPAAGPLATPEALVVPAAITADESTGVPVEDIGGGSEPEPAVEDLVLDVDAGPSTGADLVAIKEQLEVLARETAAFNERSAAREALLNRAHDEIERLRQGERRSLLQPLLRELTLLRNDLVMQSQSLPADYTVEQASRLLVSFADSVVQTLARFGVEPVTPSVGDALNFREHRRVGTVSTSDPALAGTIGGVRSDGYRDVELDRQLSHAEVLVSELEDPAQPEATVLPPVAEPAPPDVGEAPDAASAIDPADPRPTNYQRTTGAPLHGR